MELFLKSAVSCMLALVLILTVGKQEKDISLLLGIIVCCMTAFVALQSFRPIFDFLCSLEELVDLRECGMDILLKAVGIGLISELVAALCSDAGHGALGKQIQLLATVIILGMSLPLLETMLHLIENLLGEL